MNERETFKTIRRHLGYDVGLVERPDEARSALQRHLILDALRDLGRVDALYFSGDLPVICFRLLSEFDEEDIKTLHRRIWNQSRIPLLFVVTPSELRIYSCFERPAKPGPMTPLDTQDRLIQHLDLATDSLDAISEFSRPSLDSGAIWRSHVSRYFRSDRRADYQLLTNLQHTRRALHDRGLDYPAIHSLLGRSLFMLYLEDRHAVDRSYYARFVDGAEHYYDVLGSLDGAYRLFGELERKFNGDLFPITAEERGSVKQVHLDLIREVFAGTVMLTGQGALWRPYDFGVIPIELISAIYEQFLRAETADRELAEVGAYYTPHALVEFVLNEVLPWPSEDDFEHDLRVLDPACGSGIFLVEAFRRLVSRWSFSRGETAVPHDKLMEILTRNIHGIDINPNAIRIAAFSLYLAVLDYLEPKTIWEQLRFPYLVWRPGQPDRYGKNLFAMDAIKSGPFEQLHYDVVVGNPPWKRGNLPADIAAYCDRYGFAQEMAQAFLWRARDFAPHGRIGLMATSKVLHNIESNDRTFRRKFFTENYVETVVDFSVLRRTRGGNSGPLFPSAVGPACVFFYRPRLLEEPSSTLLYCAPKPTESGSALHGVVIEPAEMKFLPRRKCQTSDAVWKVAMWGTQRDLELIERLRSMRTLRITIMDSPDWSFGRGLQQPGHGDKEAPDLMGFPIIPTRRITRYRLDRAAVRAIPSGRFYRAGARETYYAPHVLLKRSSYQKRLCAAFVEFDCAFTDSVFGITTTLPESETKLKALTAYLNSSFAAYYLFLTAAMWGVERDRLSKAEILDLPDILFGMPDAVMEELSGAVDRIWLSMEGGKEGATETIADVERAVDDLICCSLGLSHTERILIEDTLRYRLALFEEGRFSEAAQPVDLQDLLAYAQTFCSTINSILQFGAVTAHATVYSGRAPLRVVSVDFVTAKRQKAIALETSTDQLDLVLARLEAQLLAEYSESIYLRRNLKFHEPQRLHIVKPAEKRFWTRSMALCDADDTLAEGLSVEAADARQT